MGCMTLELKVAACLLWADLGRSLEEKVVEVVVVVVVGGKRGEVKGDS